MLNLIVPVPDKLEVPSKFKSVIVVCVPPKDIVSAPIVSELFVNDELPIFDKVFDNSEIVLFVSVSVMFLLQLHHL